MFYGYSWISWLISVLAAIFVFLLLMWLIPLLLGLIPLYPPHVLVVLFCALVALGVLFNNSWRGRLRA
jgi:hypothetical protein